MNRLHFDEEEHSYYFNGKKLTSVTTFIDQFFPKFRKDEMSGAVAQKMGVSQEEVLKMWENKRDEAADFGTKVHKYAENYIGSLPLPVYGSEKERIAFEAVRNYLDEFLVNHTVIGAEYRVFNPSWGIAGTIDVVAKNNVTGKYIIIDFKTNANLFKRAYGKAFKPIEHLPNDKITKYHLQLNLYGLLHDKNITDFRIVYINSSVAAEYRIPDLSKEIFSMIEAHNDVS